MHDFVIDNVIAWNDEQLRLVNARLRFLVKGEAREEANRRRRRLIANIEKLQMQRLS